MRKWNWKRSVAAVATAPLPTGPPWIIDGVELEPGLCVLATREPNFADNGVYMYRDGTLARAGDDMACGDMMLVEGGVCYENTVFVCTTDGPIVCGTTGVDFEHIPRETAAEQPTVTAIDCPKCGAPVHRGQSRCEYCNCYLEFGRKR